MALSADQIYALNMLTYAGFDGSAQSVIGGDTAKKLMEQAADSGYTVKQYVESLEAAFGDNATKYQDTFDQLKSDPTLSQMTIANYKQMEDSASNMIVFTDDASSEAVVAFEGSQSAADWRDNFDGVGATSQADGVSTEFQVRSLDYINEVQDILSQYDTVTTTGHSKGGNNATYTNVMSDLVDRSVTFDAPGFSDEFYAEYADRISQVQDSVDNYSAHTDYVNILQNSIGEQHFVEMIIPDGYSNYIDHENWPDFLVAHDPTVLQNHFYDGKPEVSQHPGLQAVDKLLNSYLRDASDSEKKMFASIVGDTLARMFYKEDMLVALKKIFEERGVLADFLGFCINYINEHPEEGEAMLDWLELYHPDEIAQLRDILGSTPGKWIVKGLSYFSKKANPDAPPDGADLHVPSAPAKYDHIVFDIATFESLNSRLRRLGRDLHSCRSTVNACADSCDDIHLILTITMTLHFILSSGLKLFGSPEHILRKVADSLSDLESEVNQLCNRFAQLQRIIEEGESDCCSRVLSLSTGDPAPARAGEA